MNGSLEKILFDPVIGKLITAVIGVLLVIVIVRIVQRAASRYIRETNTRYRARKFISFLGYIIVVVVLVTIYSDKLGGLTVALGVAGAGIAFALQEVIASVAGWFAISFASFYKTGDRVQLGGIKGDVVDIGILRTTLMEVGQWVNGDLYNGRVVRVANSFVFKEPVFNYSGDFPFLWDEIVLPIKYGSDMKLARKLIADAADDILGDYAAKARVAWDDLVKRFPIENAQVEPLRLENTVPVTTVRMLSRPRSRPSSLSRTSSALKAMFECQRISPMSTNSAIGSSVKLLTASYMLRMSEWNARPPPCSHKTAPMFTARKAKATGIPMATSTPSAAKMTRSVSHHSMRGCP